MKPGITYWLAEHPAIVGFRWSDDKSWGSSWLFLVSSLSLYILVAATLRLLLQLAGRRRAVPLGPLPALHSLAMVLASAVIFLGILLSALAEIRETRWSWRRSRITSPAQWLLCFPLGTRPTGRVFFWSYAFYLTRFLHLVRTFFNILRRRRRALAGVFRHAALVCMSFIWLEFSQSFQVVAILFATLAQVVVFGYRLWASAVLPAAAPCAVAGEAEGARAAPVVVACQVALMGCNLVCHFGVLLLHLKKGGCNGIGAWVFNSVLNAALLVLFVDCYVKDEASGGGRKKGESLPEDYSSPAGDACGLRRRHPEKEAEEDESFGEEIKEQ